jgi:hypothetical protein
VKMTIYFHNETDVLVFYPKLKRKCGALLNKHTIPATWTVWRYTGAVASSGQNVVCSHYFMVNNARDFNDTLL